MTPVDVAFATAGALLLVGATVQGMRRWRQGDRAPVLVVVGLVVAVVAAWALAMLLPLLGIGGQ